MSDVDQIKIVNPSSSVAQAVFVKYAAGVLLETNMKTSHTGVCHRLASARITCSSKRCQHGKNF